MLDVPANSWRTERREAAQGEILRVAGGLAREQGLSGWTLRDLARRLGMAAPSLYSYFESKDALHDAMFAEGYREMLKLEIRKGHDLRGQLGLGSHAFVRFCLEDPVRYQLLFQRTIPGFTPSDDSWALARAAYDRVMSPLAEFGLVDQPDLDLVTAVVSGLVDQQLSNDPGGDRWVKLLDSAMDMLAAYFANRPAAPAGENGGRRRRE
jgi:AcrR family transcriptional regulator